MKLWILTGLLFCIQQHLQPANGEDKECKAVQSKLMKVQMKHIGDCTKELKFKDSADKKKRQSCLMKCVMKKIGSIGADGQTDMEGSKKFFRSYYAENIWEKADKLMDSCNDHSKNLDNNDPTCKSYDAMIKCGMQAFNKFCN